MLETFIFYSTLNIENPSFSKKLLKKTKKPFSLIAKGFEIVKLPLLDTFRTFKGNITIENVRLIS
jgi:hypothetical protein